jgi:hypothetical protein
VRGSRLRGNILSARAHLHQGAYSRVCAAGHASTGNAITAAEIQDILTQTGIEWRPEACWGGPHKEYLFGQDCNSSGELRSFQNSSPGDGSALDRLW